MQREYLTAEHLQGFENYKYSSKDTSPLSKYVMHPFWNKTILICPKWVAPNLLTFLGFMFTVATLILLTWLDYDFYGNVDDHPEATPLPNWAFTASSLFLFLAYTLDGIDGKQARRTGTSGPLGELFDHGLDSYTACIIPIAMFSIFGRSERFSITTVRMYWIVVNVLFNFYLTHWEKYNTGQLFLPWAYDISMWAAVFTFLAGGIFGHSIWQFTMMGITAGHLFEIILYVTSVVFNVPPLVHNMYVAYRDKTGHMLSFTESVRPLVPVVVFFIMTTAWALGSEHILEKEPRVLFIIVGTIFSNICCRLIVAQMSNTRADIFNWLLVPTAVAVTASLTLRVETVELSLAYALCIIAILAHIHYGTHVVTQMCRHFRIKCFKIKTAAD